MYNTRPWSVTPPDGYRPLMVQTNVNFPPGTDPGQGDGLMKVAQQIVARNNSAIGQWVDAQRRKQYLTGDEFNQQYRNFDGMVGHWSINQGYEKLRLEIYPQGGKPPPSSGFELNLDGYVVWVHADPYYPDIIQHGSTTTPSYPGPFNIFFNGYLIEQDYQPQGPCGGYPILFGKTALRAESYVGDVEHIQPLKGSPNGLAPLVIPPPGWGKRSAGDSPTGASQEAIDRELGYWIFDWANIHNPCSYVRFGFDGGAQQWNALGKNGNPLPAPIFDKGLYFKDASNSPLKPQGKNGFSVRLSPQSKGAEEVTTYDVFLGEFYDRGALRTVSQSWSGAGGTISVNDNPLIYGNATYWPGFGFGGGTKFNLDPNYTKAFQHDSGDIDDDLLGTHDAPQYGGSPNSGLTHAQLVEYDDWVMTIQALEVAYSTKIQGQLLTLQQQIDAEFPNYERAYKMAILVREIKSNALLYETFFPDYDNIYWDPVLKVHITPGGPFTDPTTPIVISVTVDNSKSGEVVAQTDGPTQTYYFDLSEPLNTFANEATRGQAIAFAMTEYYKLSPGSDTISGSLETRTTVVTPNPPPSDDYYQPGGITIAAFAALADDYINVHAKNYNDLIKKYQTLLNSLPPDAPPIPNFGDDYTNFGYSNITIDADVWRYDL